MKNDVDTLPWYGLHHVALATNDLDETMVFYRKVLGATTTPVETDPERGRHCIILFKPEDPHTWGLHFWERKMEPAIEQRLLHIAFRLLDMRAVNALRSRLKQHDIEVQEIPRLNSLLFFDNNGIMLEVTWPAKDAKE